MEINCQTVGFIGKNQRVRSSIHFPMIPYLPNFLKFSSMNLAYSLFLSSPNKDSISFKISAFYRISEASIIFFSFSDSECFIFSSKGSP